MEWKKEKISSSELEKRQKEYMSAAMSMMKRSSAPKAAPPEPEQEPEPAEITVPAESMPEQPEPAAAVAAVTAEADVTVTVTVPTDQASDNLSEEAEKAESRSDAAGEVEPVPDEEPHDAKYGVYTADELLQTEYRDDGLKKAAEILEEMTKSTAMMKKLAEGDDCAEAGTTDFPDFSCGDEDEDCGESGSVFREEDSKEECPPEDECAQDE